MFNSVSMTGSGMLLLALTTLLSWLGINATNGQVQGWVNDILDLVSLTLMVWGQLRRSDLSWGFWKTNKTI